MDETWKWRIGVCIQFLLVLTFSLTIFIAGEWNALNFQSQVKEFCGNEYNSSINAFAEGGIWKTTPNLTLNTSLVMP